MPKRHERTIKVILRRDTWPRIRAPPRALAALEGPKQIDMRQVLAEINRRTAPPLSRGFTLAECWAWHRYYPALADDPDLRLREEWTDLDTHQKAILSDDFGVGITMLFICESMNLKKVCHVGYFISQVKGGTAYLRRRGRRGKGKSPDFVAVDDTGHYHVVECKGTQNRRSDLRSQLNRGLEQKRNLVINKLQRGESLVAGCFVPQWESRETACLEIRDPEPEDPFEVNLPAEDVMEIVARGSLASELHAIGLPTLGNRVAQQERGGALNDQAVKRELGEFRPERLQGREIRRRELRFALGDVRGDQRRPLNVRVAFTIDEDALQAIAASNAPVRELRGRSGRQERSYAEDETAVAESDLGIVTEVGIDDG